MPLYLVRHAKAGSRSGWVGPDETRPLSKSGREQAQGITRALAEFPVPRILSSPYVRCVDTVQPLAAKLGLQLETTPSLAEGRDVRPVIELLASVPDYTVLCSHGDVIPAVIDALQRRGMAVEGEPDWRKGATWIIERDGDEFMRTSATPPPA
jgi:8-oxo-dGTP diphosphatase